MLFVTQEAQLAGHEQAPSYVETPLRQPTLQTVRGEQIVSEVGVAEPMANSAPI